MLANSTTRCKFSNQATPLLFAIWCQCHFHHHKITPSFPVTSSKICPAALMDLFYFLLPMLWLWQGNDNRVTEGEKQKWFRVWRWLRWEVRSGSGTRSTRKVWTTASHLLPTHQFVYSTFSTVFQPSTSSPFSVVACFTNHIFYAWPHGSCGPNTARTSDTGQHL